MLPATTPSALPVALLDMPGQCRASESWSCAAVYAWTGNETLAQGATWLIGKPLAIVLIVLVALVARRLAARAIDRLVQRAATAPTPDDPRTFDRRTQRAGSLGSLLKSCTTALVLGIAFVMVLSELGVDVAPILASAGVLGLAIGFGAQNLVKDFLSGVMMMVEDQYGVGDVVDLGEAIGTVENVGLRVTRVRAIDGTVWYVRNGEILRVGNQSQNWARTVLDIAVGYSEDLDRVRRVLSEVARGLWEDEGYRDVVIEEPEVWGVENLAPEGVIVRVTLKTAPMQQWAVAREMRERIKARFDQEGITMLLPQRVAWQQDPATSATSATSAASPGS